jgi:hypothetical protein
VVGYLSQQQTNSGAGGNPRWCPACAEANATKRRAAEGGVPMASADELVELRKPNRNLVWLSLLQAVIVAVIIAGSICIAMGLVVGVYLATIGTLAWCAACFGLRKLGD